MYQDTGRRESIAMPGTFGDCFFFWFFSLLTGLIPNSAGACTASEMVMVVRNN
jgi:hypothetical protein